MLKGLNLSNVLLVLLTVQAAIHTDWGTVTLAALGFLNFMVSEFCANDQAFEEIKDLKARLDKLGGEFELSKSLASTGLAEAFVSIERLETHHKTIQKIADDTKKMVSEGNLAGAFIPRAKRQGL